MNERDIHDDGERATLYALNALDAEERRTFEVHLAEGCARCAADVESHSAVAGDLALAPRPVAPPARVRARVMAAVAAEDKRDRRYQFDRQNDGSWVEITRGVLQKQLGPEAGFLLRMAPGTQIPRHRHAIVEHCYVLGGEVLVANETLHVGDYHRAEFGSVHDSVRTKTGCLLLIVERPAA